MSLSYIIYQTVFISTFKIYFMGFYSKREYCVMYQNLLISVNETYDTNNVFSNLTNRHNKSFKIF